jgi:uncharacterized lipoprotein YddW (UPF0748 family)
VGTGWRLLLLATTVAMVSCTSLPPVVQQAFEHVPPAPREFRGMWVATVANIDWPSRRDLSVAQQIDEIARIVQTAKRLNFNALILQVRPAADAIYHSPLEPWSEYVTGTQGRAPEPFYDPLSTWITMAHDSGLELHAWFNPYRARHTSALSTSSTTHVSKTHPHVVRDYGDQQWMEPGEPDATKHTLAVIRDVVHRYDVDAVHIDDYFYPYPVKLDAATTAGTLSTGLATELTQTEVDFPDDESWRRYLRTGGHLSRADWRRDNVNRLVAAIYRTVHEEKPWVKFGLSPFGLGKPEMRPAGIEGFSQYDKLYADVELWLREGWLDYLAPQLYWPVEQTAQAFPVLLRYWTSINPHARHVWPGLFTSRINDTDVSWQPDEIVRQVNETRVVAGATGQIHFSAVALVQNRKGIADMLLTGPYASEALVPETPWLRDSRAAKLAAPVLKTTAVPPKDGDASTSVVVLVDMPERGEVRRFAIWARYGNSWQFSVQPAATRQFTLSVRRAEGLLKRISVAAVDRYGGIGSIATTAMVATTMPD